MSTGVRQKEWVTNLDFTQLQSCPNPTTVDDMPALCWCLVGRSKDAAILCMYKKHATEEDDLLGDSFPSGVFLELTGDMRYWDVAEVFDSPSLHVWLVFPSKIVTVADDRGFDDDEVSA